MDNELQLAIQEWIENVKLRKVIATGAEAVLWAKRGILRLYIPADLLEGGAVPQGDLATILSLIRIEAVHPKQAAVITPQGSSKSLGIYTYTAGEDEDAAELTYLSEAGSTVIRNTYTGERVEMELNGRLTMHQMERSLLVTDSLRRLQKKVNHAATAENSNLGLAGWVARLFLNAQMPGDYKRDAEGNEILDASGQPIVCTGACHLWTRNNCVCIRASSTDDGRWEQSILQKSTIHSRAAGDDRCFCENKRGQQTGDAVSSATGTRLSSLLKQQASGESRLQARGDYENSLLKTAAPVEEAFVWAVETAVSMAAFLAGEQNPFEESRVTAQAHLDLGVITPKEKETAKSLYEAKIISHQTALKWCGIDNPDAEIQQVQEEQAANGETEGTDETGQDPTG